MKKILFFALSLSCMLSAKAQTDVCHHELPPSYLKPEMCADEFNYKVDSTLDNIRKSDNPEVADVFSNLYNDLFNKFCKINIENNVTQGLKSKPKVTSPQN